jgi:hypothetical protein
MKKPALARGPKLSSAIAQPQRMMTSGVRQVPVSEVGRRLSAATAMGFLDARAAIRAGRMRCMD